MTTESDGIPHVVPRPAATTPIVRDAAPGLEVLRVRPLHPRLRRDADGRIAGVMLPGQPGYDEAVGAG
jgi:hypothetical protein